MENQNVFPDRMPEAQKPQQVNRIESQPKYIPPEKLIEDIQQSRNVLIKRIENGEGVNQEDVAALESAGIDLGEPANAIPLAADLKILELMPEKEKEKMFFEAGGHTVEDPQHPGTNEDTARISRHGAFALGDGVGTGTESDVASMLATDKVVETLELTKIDAEAAKQNNATAENLANRFSNGVKFAFSKAVNSLQTFRKRFDNYFKEPSDQLYSTLTYGVFNERNGKFFLDFGHMGDTRLYRIRNKEIERLTRDTSALESLVDYGIISPEEARKVDQASTLDDIPDKTLNIPKGVAEAYGLNQNANLKDLKKIRNIITGSVNSGVTDMSQFQSGSTEVQSNDIYLALGDGITDPVAEVEIRDYVIEAFNKNPDVKLNEVAKGLVGMGYGRFKSVLKQGEKPHPRAKSGDDATALIFKIKDLAKYTMQKAVKETNALETLKHSNPETAQGNIKKVLTDLEAKGIDTSKYPKDSVTDLARALQLRSEIEGQSQKVRSGSMTAEQFLSKDERLLQKAGLMDTKNWKGTYKFLKENGFKIDKGIAKNPRLLQEYIHNRLKNKEKLNRELMELSGGRGTINEMKDFLTKVMPHKAGDVAYINYKAKKLKAALEYADLSKQLKDYTDKEREALKIYYEMSATKPPLEKKTWWKRFLGRANDE